MSNLVFLLATLIPILSYAVEKSDPFFLAVTGRVCDSAGKCQRYNGDSGNFQIDMTSTGQKSTGEMKITCEIEGVTVTNSFNLNVRNFNGEPQTEIYIEIKNSVNNLSATGVSVVAKTLGDLNMISPSGAVFEANNYKITPELVVGPSVK